MAAQESRDRKKYYFRDLEATNTRLASENANLARRVSDLETMNRDLATRLSGAISWAASVAAQAIVPHALQPAPNPPRTLPDSPPLSSAPSTPPATDPFLLPRDAFLPLSNSSTSTPLAGLGSPAEASPIATPETYAQRFPSPSPSPVPSLSPDFDGLDIILDQQPRMTPFPAGSLPVALAMLPAQRSRQAAAAGAAAWLDSRFTVLGAVVGVWVAASSVWSMVSKSKGSTLDLGNIVSTSNVSGGPSPQRTPASSASNTSSAQPWVPASASSPALRSPSLDLVLDPPASPPSALLVSALLAILASWGASTASARSAAAVRGAGSAAWTAPGSIRTMPRAYALSPSRNWVTLSSRAAIRPFRASPTVAARALHGVLSLFLTPGPARIVLSKIPFVTFAAVWTLATRYPLPNLSQFESPYQTARTSFWLPHRSRPLVASETYSAAMGWAGSSKFGNWARSFGVGGFQAQTAAEASNGRAGGAGRSRGAASWNLGSMGVEWLAGRRAALAPVTVAMTSERKFGSKFGSFGGVGGSEWSHRGFASRAGEVVAWSKNGV
ncbi:hypothetical protein HDU93_006134 [Gonapodya sp. JEL0774]|nr:hypothetical protein HDU93_006134 [Gonapodya sp. JEL0774]